MTWGCARPMKQSSIVAERQSEKTQKLRMSLITPDYLEALSRVRDFGVRKHGLDSHSLYPSELYIDAILRHLTAYRQGELNDPETNIHHLAHISINCMFLMERDVEPWWIKLKRWWHARRT